LFFLLKFETRDRVNDVFYLLRRGNWHSILIHWLFLFLIVLLILLIGEILLVTHILCTLRNSIEEKLLVLNPIGRVGVALLGTRLLLLILLRLTIEHPIEIHVHLRVLGLKLRKHVLNIAHDTL
jgi:hypothetical protein